ncbi:MAG: hypothetical protein FRX48_08601 [Lasallia pustulata]|uniref:Uncharacterized protein n=1 Tax=Lasallia pustulata TaxID=136370 RepID=A0A5M8PF82_9LECA|nr:MAG: hypothetical protein FRX48_08601 [Lasallia pustulata]
MPNNKSNHPPPQLVDYLTTHDPHEVFRGSQYAPSFDQAQAMAQSLQAWDDAWARMSTQKGEGAQGMVTRDHEARHGLEVAVCAAETGPQRPTVIADDARIVNLSGQENAKNLLRSGITATSSRWVSYHRHGL